MSGHGPLGAVAASVRVAPGSTAQQVANRIMPAGRLAVGDVGDTLITLRVIGVVAENPRGRWHPGRVTLEDLPVPLAELETTWARECRKRRRHAHRYEIRRSGPMTRHTVQTGGRTITLRFGAEPPVTRAPVAAAGRVEAPATRESPAAGDRPGRVSPGEQAALRGSLGWLLYGERAARGWSQEVLAARARVGFTTVRDLERGAVRPSDRMCRRLAEGLAFDRDPLAMAVLDLRLQRAAGPSLRRWHRRRPPRVAAQRLYIEAAAVIDAEDTTRQAERDATAAAFLEEFTTQWRADAASAGGPSNPAQAWPRRWPRVR